MTRPELQKLVQSGEGEKLEFKKKANYPEKIVKELVAFANTHGGTLLLGVDDNGELTGTRDIEGEAFILEQAINELIRPRLEYELNYHSLTEKKGIAIFHIPESSRKTHFVRENKHTRKGKAYVRVNDESVQASREVREILQRRLKNRDIQFTYGEKEKHLLNYLGEHPHITLEEFVKLINCSRYSGSRTLIRLVLANVLEITPHPKGDLYSLKG
ncbi:helix-turn-helix domain-containing protein [Roseivirga sp.]|uniref:AlbA family DNA-binding domain-containing protein n=1 Tax=Roseivirga sp. TaxID=1964215 RepID=UPI003B51FC0C